MLFASTYFTIFYQLSFQRFRLHNLIRFFEHRYGTVTDKRTKSIGAFINVLPMSYMQQSPVRPALSVDGEIVRMTVL